MLPLRDCVVQEINMFCHFDSLKTIKLSTGLSSSINSLVSSFVALLQEENPSRERTIVRIPGKLIPFQFNRIPEIIDGNVPFATRRRQKRYNLKSNESVSSESCCSLCNSHLTKVRLLIGAITKTAEVVTLFIILAVQVVNFRYFHQIRHQWRNFIWIFRFQWLPGQTRSTMPGQTRSTMVN